MRDTAQKIISHERSEVTDTERSRLLGQRAVTVWLTGLSGSGKSTLAMGLERRLVDLGRACYVLDGDNLRHGINRDLGFSAEDRQENIRRAAEVARLFNDAGLIVIAAFISPYRVLREEARHVVSSERFIEVYLSADVATCEARDPKGLYRKAREGRITDFTGVNAPYEAPDSPHLSLDTGHLSIASSLQILLGKVLERIVIPGS